MSSQPARGKTSPASTSGSFAPYTHGLPDVSLSAPVAPRKRTLDDLAAAGYITDEWSRWQQGGCQTYALALIRLDPTLRLGVLGETDDGDAANGWSISHFIAHDDTYAYDSAGRHPLPYYGVALSDETPPCDYAELDQDPDWHEDPGTDQDRADAEAHALRHGIITASPTATLFPHPGEREQATAFTFDWDRLSHDDYQGWMAYDPAAPRRQKIAYAQLQPGDEIDVPGTASVPRPIGTTRYDGTAAWGWVSVWTSDQDPERDKPIVQAGSEDMITVLRPVPPLDLSDPAQFSRELARRVYEETANQASAADEPHDVVRIANRLARGIAQETAVEALGRG
jgi:hypothetical protein